MDLVKSSKNLCLNVLIFIQKSGSGSYVKQEAPDILCIQETKCQENDVPKVQCEVTFS